MNLSLLIWSVAGLVWFGNISTVANANMDEIWLNSTSLELQRYSILNQFEYLMYLYRNFPLPLVCCGISWSILVCRDNCQYFMCCDNSISITNFYQ